MLQAPRWERGAVFAAVFVLAGGAAFSVAAERMVLGEYFTMIT